jgi:uncharacterized Zn-binding protein involved in type VI secretion
MPRVSTKVDVCKGHDACPRRAFRSFSPNVFVEGIAMVREGDSLKPHGCDDHTPHSAKITRGWGTVTANGRRVGYVGASVSCASSQVATGRPSVWVGEGG